MSLDIPLDSMSVADKLIAIEKIWDSLRRSEDSLPIPAWHQDVLKERMDRIRSGEAGLLNWDDVKQRLNKLGS